MNRNAYKGSITIFLSLACILFLALICAVTESARVQGAKAQSANITGMGTVSLLSEFEPKLLEKYEIFSLDGAAGGSFRIQTVNSRFEEFITRNTNPKRGLLMSLTFDPWCLELKSCEITDYALLTDDKGEAFYQQAVSYMKANVGVIALEELLKLANSTDEIEEKQEAYETSQNSNDGQMSGLEEEKQEKLEALESEAADSGSDTSNSGSGASNSGSDASASDQAAGNPLTEIAKLRKKSTLEIVTWDKTLSEKSVTLNQQPSKSNLRSGSLDLEAEHSGLVSNVLFREYLVRFFPNFVSGETGAGLDYQLEYILGGKATDKNNLKYVVNRLLLLREGMNYAFSVSDQTMNSQAGALATTLTGFLGIPALTEATKHALLLAWSYGESLIDVRVLLDGGKIPLAKDEDSWSLTLENLGRVTEVLQAGAEEKEDGLSYQEYIRILLNMGSLPNQKMRALDLIQTAMRAEDGMSGFQVQNCIVGVKVRATYQCGQVFWGLSAAVLGASGGNPAFTQTAGLAY